MPSRSRRRLSGTTPGISAIGNPLSGIPRFETSSLMDMEGYIAFHRASCPRTTQKDAETKAVTELEGNQWELAREAWKYPRRRSARRHRIRIGYADAVFRSLRGRRGLALGGGVLDRGVHQPKRNLDFHSKRCRHPQFADASQLPGKKALNASPERSESNPRLTLACTTVKRYKVDTGWYKVDTGSGTAISPRPGFSGPRWPPEGK